MSFIGEKIYTTKQFTVTVEKHQDHNIDKTLKDFKWVRIYANVSTIKYTAESKLLLGCTSGSTNVLTLLKEARLLAKTKLSTYQDRAQAILALSM
jgi:hypothetical protein